MSADAEQILNGAELCQLSDCEVADLAKALDFVEDPKVKHTADHHESCSTGDDGS